MFFDQKYVQFTVSRSLRSSAIIIFTKESSPRQYKKGKVKDAWKIDEITKIHKTVCQPENIFSKRVELRENQMRQTLSKTQKTTNESLNRKI